MEFTTKIFVFLTIFLKLVSSQSDCKNNTYQNDPKLLPLINGFLYTYVTSASYGSNEIFDFWKPVIKNQIYVRTTNDIYQGCCVTLDLKTIEDKGGYFTYWITTDDNCASKLNEGAYMKLLAANQDNFGYCIILWTCREGREGVHAFCQKTQQTKTQQKWIADYYAKLGLTEVQVSQNTVLENDQNCFSPLLWSKWAIKTFLSPVNSK